MLRRILCLSAFLLCPSMSHAELYQWKDEQGHVHFSDKKPSSEEAKVLAPSSTSGMPALDLPEPKPGKFNSQYDAVPLQIEELQFQIPPNSRVLTYYFGGDCVSPTTMQWDELTNENPELISTASGFGDLAREVLHNSKISFREIGTPWLPNEPDLSLEGRVVSIDLHACARKTPGGRNPRYSMLVYLHSTALVTIEWTLKTIRRPQKTLMTISTKGAAPLPTAAPGEQTIPRALRNAYKNALASALENAEFFEHLRRPPPAPQPTSQQLVPEPAPEEPGLFEQLSDLLRALKQAVGQ